MGVFVYDEGWVEGWRVGYLWWENPTRYPQSSTFNLREVSLWKSNRPSRVGAGGTRPHYVYCFFKRTTDAGCSLQVALND